MISGPVSSVSGSGSSAGSGSDRAGAGAGSDGPGSGPHCSSGPVSGSGSGPGPGGIPSSDDVCGIIGRPWSVRSVAPEQQLLLARRGRGARPRRARPARGACGTVY